MAFSASTDYTESYTAASVIARALKRIGMMDASESVNATEQADALEVLNLIVKEWAGMGADVWVRNTGHLFLVSPGTVDGYTLGTSGTAKFTSSYRTTTLASAGSASDTTITVTDDTSMADTDIILIEEDDGTLHADTISGTPSSNSVTLSTGLASAAASGNIVYSWGTGSSISDKIVKVVWAARRVTNTDDVASNASYMEGTDAPLNIIGDDEYRSLSTKLSTGVPVSLHHRQDSVNPKIFLWPTGGSGDIHSIVLDYYTYIQDLDATTNNIDLPPEGFNALTWALASELGPEYGLSARDQDMVDRRAGFKVENFLSSMTEDASVFFARGNQ